MERSAKINEKVETGATPRPSLSRLDDPKISFGELKAIWMESISRKGK